MRFLPSLILLPLLSITAGAQLCGDCDADMDVDILDALLQAQAAAALVSPMSLPDFAACDVDGNGSVDVLDSLRTAQEAVGLQPTLSCAFNTAPLARSVAAQAPLTGTILIDYVLEDAESDLCDVLVEVSTDGGTTFGVAPTQGMGGDPITGLLTLPTGQLHTFSWDTLADLGMVDVPNVVVRVTPSDSQVGTPGTSMAFTVSNAPVLVSYSMEIQPLFDAIATTGCIQCHPSTRSLDLRTYAGLMAGSSSGAVVIPGDPGNSLIICKLEGFACGTRMPIGGTAWTPTQIQTFRDWISQGAMDN